ncbi:Peptidase M2, peptidyl-dipeptidase A family-containing protein [Strongyloides ratti]|uniref:Angiotensin-converting enzyme n=1 Tax=Strongyloides ratti TaxID=34506 RepID=A0A090LNE2_STRRB|nr:Peptidase M2, peptidyl-dipeptidase A family-containing protein [Strongyloides ratti]CEF71385.1 Peptidase M2, peptidyl-dipeptidase A family-containing protein [Strongyloides ratti]
MGQLLKLFFLLSLPFLVIFNITTAQSNSSIEVTDVTDFPVAITTELITTDKNDDIKLINNEEISVTTQSIEINNTTNKNISEEEKISGSKDLFEEKEIELFAQSSTEVIKKSKQNEIRINFDDLDKEDYHDAVENMKPAEVDDEVIDELVNKFLNTGSITGGETKEKPAFINKNFIKLINSSDYWKLDNIKEEFSINDEKEAEKWVEGYNKEAQKVLKEVSLAGWNYFVGVTPTTKQSLSEAEEVLGYFLSSTSKQAKQFNVKNIKDSLVAKQLRLISVEGVKALGENKSLEHDMILAEINKIFVNTDICDGKDIQHCIYKVTDLSSIIPQEDNVNRLTKLWKSFRDKAANSTRNNYIKLVHILNDSAKAAGFSNTAAMWNSPFDLSTRDTPPEINIMNEVQNVQNKLMPLYKEIHTYIRHYLPVIYQNATDITRDGPIPGHLLKSYNGDDWSAFYDTAKPFDDIEDIESEIMNALHAQNITVKGMFTKAYRYFKYLGFEKAPSSVWSKSVFTRMWSRSMICNPSTSIDMNDGIDYRIKTCEILGIKGFKQAHKLIADMYYQFESKDQPLLLHDAPNPSFKSALSNAISIAAGNTDYLKSLKLLPENYVISENAKINSLFKEAIEEFVKLPSYLIVDLFRQEIFEDTLSPEEWNEEWWRLRTNLQGIKSPLKDEKNDNDVLVNTYVTQKHSPAIRYIISYVIQFQILRALCPDTPSNMLFNGCVLDKDIMSKIEIIMKEGATIDYLTALEMITGDRKFDATPIIEYFSPLYDWLKKYNEEKGLYVGWDGKGEKFNESELPKVEVVQTGVARNEFGNEGKIAYPGQDCSKGEDCLLESICNGTRCICGEGLFTLEVAGTYSCVKGNPSKAGFGDGSGGLLIGLFEQSSSTTTLSPSTTSISHENRSTKSTISKENKGSKNIFNYFLVVFLITFYLFRN